MSVPSTARGEVRVHLAGRDFLLRPSFAALAETETMAGCGLVPLARRFVDGGYGLRDVVAVLLPALKAGGTVPAGDVGDLVLDRGLLAVAPACAALLAAALGPGEAAANPL
ncbi:gene transfer agent family protein [Zavarzinia compransoris]|uniref:GTA-gp10 family protein n=1 Tax=Zavarzinia marina TaxID=2911065 RepID=UPI001F435103|nr:GTA-gp10 family protein [Zavarzinia marina]MCF4166473.1 gene transfer agent family protein [Zavarzinia marina]